jgi:hypothetical protein
MQTAVETGRKTYPTARPGVRVLLLSDREGGPTASRLARCGSLVDVEDALETALARLRRDPMGYDLFVMDCDGYGGISGGERAVCSLIAAEARLRVMLLSCEFEVPALPFGRRAAVCLPATAGDAEFRMGFDHVLRDREPVVVM